MDEDFPLAKKVRLTYLAMFRPDRFTEIVRNYNPPTLDAYMTTDAFQRLQLTLVRRGWARSFMLVLATLIIGFLIGQILEQSWPSSPVAVLFGGVGGLTILWATIALRGWELQTTEGSSLAEQVNRWTYRGTCTIGTLLVVISASWTW